MPRRMTDNHFTTRPTYVLSVACN